MTWYKSIYHKFYTIQTSDLFLSLFFYSYFSPSNLLVMPSIGNHIRSDKICPINFYWCIFNFYILYLWFSLFFYFQRNYLSLQYTLLLFYSKYVASSKFTKNIPGLTHPAHFIIIYLPSDVQPACLQLLATRTKEAMNILTVISLSVHYFFGLLWNIYLPER